MFLPVPHTVHIPLTGGMRLTVSGYDQGLYYTPLLLIPVTARPAFSQTHPADTGSAAQAGNPYRYRIRQTLFL